MTDLFTAPTAARPLRPHQSLCLDLVKQSYRSGKRRTVVQLPTGAGKTRLAAEIVQGALAKGKTVAFTVPLVSLINQTVLAFEQEGITGIGVVQASHPRFNLAEPVQVCSLQTLTKRGVPDVDMVIVDECHIQHAIVPKWMAREVEEGRDTVFIGLSATPWARGMRAHWDDLVTPVRMRELIDAGWLSPFTVYAPSHPDMSGVKTSKGDYANAGSAEVMGGLVADVVDTWLEKGQGLPTLVFAVNRAHAAKLVAEFEAKGVTMGYCDAHVDTIERDLLFEQMARGEIAGIVNIGTLTAGVDADVRCIVLARPTKSEMLHVQIIGRGLRTARGKDTCLILDHADNHARLGFVTDIHHGELLAAGEKGKTRAEKGEPLPKACGACNFMKPPKVRECPVCKFVPEAQSGIETEEGELIEITGKKPKPVQATKDEKQRFFSELVGIAQQRGRSPGWTAHSYRDRFKVWPRGLSETPLEPSSEVLNFVRAKDIRFAKSRAAK